MRRADWRAWTLRATWLTGLANLFFFFLQSRPHVSTHPSLKTPHFYPILNAVIQNPSVHKKTKNVGQHHLAWLFSQLRHSNRNSANLVTVTCSQVADGVSPVACFFVEKWSGRWKKHTHTHKLGIQSPQCLVNTSPQNGKKDSALSLNLEGKKKM